MELRQLRYFVAVAKELNVSAASRSLNVSQPPVTRQIRQLEAELGVSFFNRTVRGMELTPAGQNFLPDAQNILAQVKRAQERARAASRGEIGHLEIGFFGSCIYSFVPDVLRHFKSLWPGVTFALHQMSKAEQVSSLREGRIHVGFARYYPQETDIIIEPVAEEQLFLACAADSRFSGLAAIDLPALCQERLVLFPRDGRPSFADEVIGMFSRFNLAPHVAHVAEDVTTALASTASGLGSSLVPQSVAALHWPGIVFVAISSAWTILPISCIYMDGDGSPVLHHFLQLLRSAGFAHRQNEAAGNGFGLGSRPAPTANTDFPTSAG